MGKGGFRPLFRRLVHLFIRIVFDFSSGGVSSATSYGGLSGEPLPRITLCSARPFGRKEAEGLKLFYIIGDNKLETLTEKASSDHGVGPSMSAFLLGSVYPQALSGLLDGDRTEDEGRSQLAEDLGKEYGKLVGNNIEIVFSTWKKNLFFFRSRRKAAWRSSLIRS